MIPKICIGMPVYNGEAFIQDALDSLLAQTFVDFELVISDNNSTDNTERICRRYVRKDKRVHYVRQATNLGFLNNFKFVLFNARNEYFMWMAADDCLSNEEYLEKLINHMTVDIEYVFPDVAVIGPNGDLLQANVMRPFKEVVTRFEFVKASLKINSYQVYGLFRTVQLKEDFAYWERCQNLPCFGEGLFVHAISAERKGKFVPAACKLYRRHEKNTSSVLPAKILLPAFLEYVIKSIKYFIYSKHLSLLEKLSLVVRKTISDIPYSIYLFLAIIAQKYPFLKLWKEKGSKLFRSNKKADLRC